MSYKVDNAIILAAGTSSRFAPLSYEMPKALIEVKGEVLVERQIRQLQEAGIHEIIIVVGYKKEQFEYLKDKYGVILIENKEYLTRNNHSSIYAVKNHVKNSYICSSDNYFLKNPFENEVDEAYYAAVFSKGDTEEWCMEEDEQGNICKVTIGGHNAWYMLGHAFWNEKFSGKFIEILEEKYEQPEIVNLLWEYIFMMNLQDLKMKIRKYPENYIFEFDTLDELRKFDCSYVVDAKSQILKSVAQRLKLQQQDIIEIKAYKDSTNAAAGFTFKADGKHFRYNYKTESIELI